MSSTQKGVREGYHTTTPYLMINDADRAVRFYQSAFDAVELHRSTDPAGVIRNIQIKIGDSPVMLGIRPEFSAIHAQEPGELPLASIYLMVEDADRVFQQAVDHGATPLYPPEDMEYGYREGGLVDPFGVTWWVATTLTP